MLSILLISYHTHNLNFFFFYCCCKVCRKLIQFTSIVELLLNLDYPQVIKNVEELLLEQFDGRHFYSVEKVFNCIQFI